MDRLQQLLEFYQQDPHDAFNIYALALEYAKSDLARAKAYFEILLTQHQDYLPTYYHAAKFFASVDDTSRAISLYERGIELAKQKRDFKTQRELQSALDELTFE